MHLTQFWVRCVCPHNTITQSRVYSSRLTIASCRFPVVAGWKFRIAHSELAWHRVLIARTQLSLTGQLAYVPQTLAGQMQLPGTVPGGDWTRLTNTASRETAPAPHPNPRRSWEGVQARKRSSPPAYPGPDTMSTAPRRTLNTGVIPHSDTLDFCR